MSFFPTLLYVDDLMIKSKFFQAGIATPPISAGGCPRCYDFRHERKQAGGTGIVNSAETYPAKPSTVQLDGNDNQDFFLYSSAKTSLFGSADIRFVYLNRSMKTISTRTDHRTAHLVEPCPCGLIAPKTQNTLDVHSTGSILLAGNKPHCVKPGTEGLSCAFEDRSSRYGCLAIAGTAVKQAARRIIWNIIALAFWTDKAIRPTQPQNIFLARILIWKAVVKFLHGPWVVNPWDWVSGGLHAGMLQASRT